MKVFEEKKKLKRKLFLNGWTVKKVGRYFGQLFLSHSLILFLSRSLSLSLLTILVPVFLLPKISFACTLINKSHLN